MDKLLVIREDGNVETLYSDDLPQLGPQKITRASNVEPDPDGDGWQVQLSAAPQNGCLKGWVIARHVPTRAEALKLEVDFIQRHILGAGRQRQEAGPVHIRELLAEILAEMAERRVQHG